jgi:hypothetical protein
VQAAVSRLEPTAALAQIERNVIDSIQKASRWFNNRKPEVIVVAWEHDPRTAAVPDLAATRQTLQQPQRAPSAAATEPGAGSGSAAGGQQQQRTRRASSSSSAGGGSSSSSRVGASSSSSSSRVGASSSSGPQKRPRVGAGRGGSKPLPPLSVLPKDVELPVTHANPRSDPAAAGPDADLAYD